MINNILSQIDLSKLLKLDYVFEVNPLANGWYLYLAIIFGILIFLAIISIFVAKRQDKIYCKLQRKFSILFLVCSIIGLFLIFFRFEQIPYFGSRSILWLLILIFIFLSGRILFYAIFTLPKEKLELLKKQKFIKYLPRRRADLPSKAAKGNSKW